MTIWSGRGIVISTGKSLTPEQRGSVKTSFIEMVSIVSGAAPSSREQVDATVDGLFEAIVTYRSGGFIQGEFLQSPDFEGRLSSMEAKIASVEKLLQELQIIFKIGRPSDSTPTWFSTTFLRFPAFR